MKPRHSCNIWGCWLSLKRSVSVTVCILSAIAGFSANNDTIYQGVTVKLDIASPIVVPAVTRWKIQHYEVAANVRLKDRFYPTLELGYAGGKTDNDTISYSGQGGFFRVGCDINPLRKHPESPHALLIGLRIGTAVQGARQGLTIDPLHPYTTQADCWGEIVAGCQVEIGKVKNTAFYMGWMGRFKFLFTREAEGLPAAQKRAMYIPGYGMRDNTGWGVNYYLGWHF